MINEIEDILSKEIKKSEFAIKPVFPLGGLLEDMDRILGGKEPPREKKPSWWAPLWGGAKDIYAWMYPQGIENLPYEWGMLLRQAGTGIGESATYLARLAPNQEDLPSYTEQDIPRQALTLAQATSMVALGGLIGYSGFTAISSLARFLAYGRADKIASKFATQHFTKIKANNPQVKTLEDAKALSQAALRGVIQPRAETTYLPTTLAELKKLGQSLLRPMAGPTSQVKANLITQTRNFLTQSGIKPTAMIMKPFIETIEHHLPGVAMVSDQYAKVLALELNRDFPLMVEQVKGTGGAVIPFERPLVTPEEEIVDIEMPRKLTPTPEEYAPPEVAPKVEIPEEVVESELQGMLVEVQRGEPGKRIQTETGEWISQPSTYPAWMGERHLTKKQVIDAFEKKTGGVWTELQGIARERLEYGYISPALGKIPSYMEQEINMGGGPALGMGIELTKKELFTEPKEKNPLGKAVDRVTSWFSVYSRVKKENPEAYVMFRHFKGGQDLAWINANQVNKGIWGKISLKDATAIQRYRQIEEVTLESLPERLRPIALKLDTEIENRKEALIARGKMEVGWPQSYIKQLIREREKLTNEIPLLKLKKAIAKRRDRIEEIDELVEVLEHRRFFPGMYQETSETQPQIIKLLPRGKWRSSQLRSKWRKGKFIPDIDTAIKWGLHPADPRAAMLDYLYWDELEKNKWVLFQGIKDDANLALLERNAPEWWNTVAIKELKGYKVNPLITEILEDFAASGTISSMNLPNAYMKLARYGKIASFYNPIIMGGIYDPQQGYMAAGITVLNPILYVRSIKSIITKDDFYKQCMGADLFPKPVDLGPQRNMDDLILSAAKQMDESCPDFTRFIEKATDGKWNFKGGEQTKNMIKFTSGAYSAEWNLTWNMDAASRMNTVKVLLARGWKFEDAIERARFYHADYGDIPSATRRFLNNVMWTPSYQISMTKVYGNLARHPIKERGPLARLIAFWLLVGTGAAIAGYRWQEGYRFVKETEEGEEVITGSGPLFFLHKYLARNPVQSAYYQSAIPIHIVWSLARNRDWKGDRIYEETDDKAMQLAKGAGYIIRTYFRPLEAMGRMLDQDEDLLNRLLAIPAVSKYTRQPRKRYERYLVGEARAKWRGWRRRHPEALQYEKERRRQVMRKEIDKILTGPKQEIWQKMPVDIINYIIGMGKGK